MCRNYAIQALRENGLDGHSKSSVLAGQAICPETTSHRYPLSSESGLWDGDADLCWSNIDR